MSSETFTEDTVRLKLDGIEVPIITQYSVKSGVLAVPAVFQITAGHGGMFTTLCDHFPPRTPFELFVGDVLCSVGETHGYAIGGSDATTMKINGSDYIRRLVKKQLLDERMFSEKSFAQLTRIALDDVGLKDSKLITSNEANRKSITGTTVVSELGPKTEDNQEDVPQADLATTRTIYKSLKAEIGHSWWDFLSKEYRRAGLFLWQTANGDFVLTRPNGNQVPLYRIVRRRGSNTNEVSVIGQPDFENDTEHRYSEVQVVGRGGGGKHGRVKFDARFIDEEMVAILNRNPADRADGGKIREPKIVKDNTVRTIEQAKLLCRRLIAESRRASWRLSYTVAGHTTPALIGGGRLVWQPDTVVEVIDDELGIEGPMYLEGVERDRSPHTTTKLHLMRCEDLLYQEEPDEDFKKKPKLDKAPPPAPKPTAGAFPWTTDPNQIERMSSIIRATPSTTDPPTFGMIGVSKTPPFEPSRKI